jgi:hypothetical protein
MMALESVAGTVTWSTEYINDYFRTFPEGPEENREKPCQDMRPVDQGQTAGSPEYKTTVTKRQIRYIIFRISRFKRATTFSEQ